MAAHCKLLCTLVLIVASTVVFGSPQNFKLLSLVPSGAGIVAGFENYPDPHRHGQLLLSTHSNRLDLGDWLAIAGVDSKRRLDEGIEVASFPQEGGLLTQHLLLVAGRFDREYIYKAAELNGAEENAFGGEIVLLVQPFTREKNEMKEGRWFVILENRIGMLGSPALVKEALQRYEAHADVDPELRGQLAQLPQDVSSWNVLLPPSTASKKIYMHWGSRWFGLVDDTEVLLVGVRFGSKVRVDFLVRANRSRDSEFFKHKVASFQQVFASVLPERLLQQRSKNAKFDRDRARGSIELSKKQFEMWAEQGSADRGLPALTPPIASNGD